MIAAIRASIFQIRSVPRHGEGLQARILDIATTHAPQLGYHPAVRFTGPLDRGVGERLAGDILAVIREAISNCARHAHATHLDICLILAHHDLIMNIVDNGCGIGASTRSSGLTNMRRRAEDHHGTLTLTRPDTGGTHLTWTATLLPPASA